MNPSKALAVLALAIVFAVPAASALAATADDDAGGSMIIQVEVPARAATSSGDRVPGYLPSTGQDAIPALVAAGAAVVAAAVGAGLVRRARRARRESEPPAAAR